MIALKRPGILAATMVLVLAAACTVEAPTDSRIGSKAPNFTLPDFEGRPVSLSNYQGKVVLLDFWATWCAPCRAEIPFFQELNDQYRDKGLQVVGVSMDENAADVVPGFLKEQQIRYTNLMWDAKVEEMYGPISGLPTTFIIDRQGTIRQQWTGVQPRDVLKSAVLDLL